MSIHEKKQKRSRLPSVVLVLLGLFANPLLVSEGWASDILIRITGNDGTAKYVGPEQSTQQPVEVRVGDRVIWQNEADTNHTATAFDNTGRLLFDTGAIPHHSATLPFGHSSPLEITADMFSRVGGTTGNSATIDYYCDFHGSMHGKLVVRESASSTREAVSKTAGDSPAATTTRTRRDITTLSSTELNAYRDAWRRIQTSGAFQTVAGFHGCPRFLCHSNESIFFPWHREYLLRLETALGGPVHYWDWSATIAATRGIPTAFTASTYVSSDGRSYPNPLFSTRFQCPTTNPIRSTFRSPRSPSLLSSYAAGVRSAYRLSNFTSFSDSINFGPHGSVHVWVNGDMRSTTNAAYDPIFWAHHSNVDRQWATWQANGKPNPPSTTLSRPLPGFAPKTAADVLSLSTLGYTYDRLDTIPVSFSDSFQDVAVAPVGGTMGVGKSFSVTPTQYGTRREAPDDAPVQLLVSGIEAHPKQSLFVYVFGNQPDARVEDAIPDNPRFLGSFGVFGGSGDPTAHAAGPNERAVMSLPAGFEARIGQAVSQITLVVVDESDSIVSREQIPFASARLEVVESTGIGRWKTFEGTSSRESYDEAYQNAVNKAYADLAATKPDSIITIRVESVEGSRGGIAGLRSLTVKIRAKLQ